MQSIANLREEYQIVPAKQYYGDHAYGSVVLCNGYPVYHCTEKRGSERECRRFIDDVVAIVEGTRTATQAKLEGLNHENNQDK